MNQITSPDMLPEFVRADIDFHLGIARAAGNPVLVAVLRSLFDCIEPFLIEFVPWPYLESRTPSTDAPNHTATFINRSSIRMSKLLAVLQMTILVTHEEKLIDKVQQVSLTPQVDLATQKNPNEAHADKSKPVTQKTEGKKSQRNRVAI